jgi:hypothetical protein
MIGEFENIAVSTGYPETNIERFTGIKSMFLTDPLFSFDTVEDFEDKAQWIYDIKAQNIFQVLGLLETEQQSEPTEYIKSDLGYQFEGNKGKYIFNFKALYKKEYHNQLSKWSGKHCMVFFADANNNVFANKIGARIYGLDVDLINIEKKQFGSIEPAYTIIKVELSDSDEFDHVVKMDFAINKINPVQVIITDLVIAGNEAEFTIKDSIYGYPIQNLYGGIVISGVDSGLTITDILNIGCGKFKIIPSENFVDGNISINSDLYYTNTSYEYYVGSRLFISNLEYWTKKVVRFKVRNDSGTLISGIILDELIVNDLIIGLVDITSITEISNGYYEIISPDDLSSGVFDINHNDIVGTHNYQVIIELEILNLRSETTDSFEFEVVTLLASDPIEDLISNDFYIYDHYSGITTITNFSKDGNTYSITINRSRTEGNISVNTFSYHVNKIYNYIGASFKNAGATGATDLIDSNSDGLADGFTLVLPTRSTASITNRPVAGRMQKLIHDSGAINVGIYIDCDYFKVNKSYKLRFYYNRENAGTSPVNISILGNEDNYFTESLLGGTSTPAALYTSETFYIPLTESRLVIYAQFNKIGMSFNIAHIELIEV